MYGYSNNADMPIYYVYAWYYVDTGEIFYIGKGKNNRYKERKVHRNQFFKNILAKHKENVDAKILESNMTESVALAREKQLISEYWNFLFSFANCLGIELKTSIILAFSNSSFTSS